MHLRDPVFPPLFTGHAVKSPAQPFDEAIRLARAGTLGAGDLVWSRNTSRADLALILEPEVALNRAQQMAPLALVAVAETIGFLAPPQVAVEFRWPGTVVVNGAVAGVVRLAAAHTPADAPPAWLVIGVTIELSPNDRDGEPGDHPERTTLSQEGAPELTRTDVIEALATRLLAWLNTWSEDGFRPIHDQWLLRAEGRDRDVTIDGRAGRVLGLDEDASLIVKPADAPARLISYRAHLVLRPAGADA